MSAAGSASASASASDSDTFDRSDIFGLMSDVIGYPGGNHHGTLDVPPELVRDMGYVIGKDGYYFYRITEAAGAIALWYDSYQRKVVIISGNTRYVNGGFLPEDTTDDEYSGGNAIIQDVINRLKERFDRCRKELYWRKIDQFRDECEKHATYKNGMDRVFNAVINRDPHWRTNYFECADPPFIMTTSEQWTVFIMLKILDNIMNCGHHVTSPVRVYNIIGQTCNREWAKTGILTIPAWEPENNVFDYLKKLLEARLGTAPEK